jgi:hypothetical protein
MKSGNLEGMKRACDLENEENNSRKSSNSLVLSEWLV